MKKNKKFKTFLYLLVLFFFVLAFQTIAYSAINGTMTVSGDAYARSDADIRITDFRLATTTNATSSFEEFGKSHIVTEVDLKNTSSSITYYLEITNYGSVDAGIFDITGLPSGVNYSIKDYNLHDKICDDSGKCNSFIKKTYEMTLTSNSTYTGSIQLNFDFRTYHKVTYTGITNNNYQAEVIDGGNFKVTFKEELKRVQVMYNNREILYYKKVLNGQTITLSNITNDIEVKIKEQVARLVNGDLNIVGSEVCIKDECFYIVSNDGEIVTLLTKYNLHVGYQHDDTYGTVPLTNPTGKQDVTAKAWFAGYTEENPLIGVISFSKTNYWANITEYPTYVYNSNSYLYQYVEAYKSYVEELGVPINTARLIKVRELENLGCNTTEYHCNAAPEWVYSTTYWTGDAFSSDAIWRVSTDSHFYDNGNGSYANGDTRGVRPVIEISIDEIEPLVRVKHGDYDTAGSEICIGDECFYVISSTNDSVTMLAKYNLYVGNECTSASASTCTKYGENATGIQDSSMIGYKLGMDIRKGTSNFANTNYWGTTISTYPSNVYNENTTAYGYVENYKNYLTTIGVTPRVARIISYEELINLGCSGTDENCRSAPSWVYATSYWTNTAANSTNLWALNTYGNFYHTAYQYTGTFGCRPVIEMSKCMLADTIEFTIDGKTYYAKEGMTWREWSKSKFNILNLYESGNILRKSGNSYLGYMINNKCYQFNLDSDIDNTKDYTLVCGSGSDD